LHRNIISLIISLCLIFTAISVDAQSSASTSTFNIENTDIAILVRGPVASRGFPLIYPNAINVWLGYYRYLEEEIVVSFTRESIMISGEWDNMVCDKIKGYLPDNKSFFYNDDDWSLLFQFSEQDLIDCDFISIFIIRLKYFLRDVSPLSPPLLPAILEIR